MTETKESIHGKTSSFREREKERERELVLSFTRYALR